MEQTFIVHPMSQRFTLDPGKSYTGTVNIANPANSKENLNYEVSVTPFGLTGYDQVDLQSENNYTFIKDWISVDEPTGSIAPNETRVVEFTIKVPENAPSGGQYAAITVAADPGKTDASDQGVAVGSVFELASIIYANVNGEIIHDGQILENNVPEFSLSTPVNISASLSNHGNIHEDATFKLLVTNAITGEQIFPTEDGKEAYTELVMPDSTRYISRSLTNLPSVGIVKVSQTIIYNGQLSTVEKNLYICPLWLLLIMAVTVSMLLSLVVYKVHSVFNRRKRKEFSL